MPDWGRRHRAETQARRRHEFPRPPLFFAIGSPDRSQAASRSADQPAIGCTSADAASPRRRRIRPFPRGTVGPGPAQGRYRNSAHRCARGHGEVRLITLTMRNSRQLCGDERGRCIPNSKSGAADSSPASSRRSARPRSITRRCSCTRHLYRRAPHRFRRAPRGPRANGDAAWRTTSISPGANRRANGCCGRSTSTSGRPPVSALVKTMHRPFAAAPRLAAGRLRLRIFRSFQEEASGFDRRRARPS